MANICAFQDDYVSAVRQNIRCGGDCCARGTVIGSCLAARNGIEDIPMDWIEKVVGIEDIIRQAIRVYS